MEWMNISYVLAFLAVFVASVSQILLKQSAEIEHKNILFKFLNWRVILGYGLLFGTTVINVFCIPRGRIEGDSHDRIHRYYSGSRFWQSSFLENVRRSADYCPSR